MAKRKTFAINKDFQKGFTQMMSAVDGYAGKLRYEIVPLTQIELDPENPRNLLINFSDLPHGPRNDDPHYAQKLKEIEKLQSLAETIKQQGLINPIVVYKNVDKYRLVAGERRCLASLLGGLTDIKANVLDQRPTAYKRSVLQWIENIEREDLTLWERMRNIEMIVKAYQHEHNTHEPVTATVIRNLLGCSLPHAMNYHAVLNADEVLKNGISANTVKNLEKAAVIARIGSESLRQKALTACIDGKPLKELKHIAKQDTRRKITKPSEDISNRDRRGRHATRIKLGFTHNTAVVKFIIDTVLRHDHYRHFGASFDKLDWRDYSSVSSGFQKLIQILETGDLEQEMQ